jgi:hypothetical protein
MDLNGSSVQKRSLARLAGSLLAIGIIATTTAGIQGSGLRMASVGVADTDGDAVVVNGVAYDVSNARVVINGRAADAAQLHAGQVLTVKGLVAPDGTTGTAREVSLVSNVRGTITSVNEAAGTLQVLGQRVRVESVAGLEAGLFVDVSGFADANGDIVASSVDIEASTPNAQVRGVVAAMDGERQTLRINDLDVDYSSAVVAGLVAPGAIVTVQGTVEPGSGALFASRVDVFAGIGTANEGGTVEGIITEFASRRDFEVDGQPVLADDNTRYMLPRGELASGTRVQVTGTFDDAGVLRAAKIDGTNRQPRKP